MRLTAGPYAAALTSRGATLQGLTHEGRELVLRAGDDDPPGAFRGVVVAPWPNRVGDGRYRFAGTEHQLPVNEPERGNALHGFSFDRTWGVGGVSATRVTMWLDLPPQPGYPWTLRLRATYVLSADGLRIELRAENTGAEPAPYGCTIHPYLTAGTPRVDDAELTLPAATRVEVDERLLPTGSAPVTDVDCDFRGGERIGDRRIDHAFTDLTPGPDGMYAATLTRPDGGGVRMTWGDWAQWVQVHTADRPEQTADRVGLALEPMSCAPDAFRSGAGLVLLEPGAEHRAWWTIGAC